MQQLTNSTTYGLGITKANYKALLCGYTPTLVKGTNRIRKD
jgi:hypothetical protein